MDPPPLQRSNRRNKYRSGLVLLNGVICAVSLARGFSKYPVEEDGNFKDNKRARFMSVCMINGMSSSLITVVCYLNEAASILMISV